MELQTILIVRPQNLDTISGDSYRFTPLVVLPPLFFPDLEQVACSAPQYLDTRKSNPNQANICNDLGSIFVNFVNQVEPSLFNLFAWDQNQRSSTCLVRVKQVSGRLGIVASFRGGGKPLIRLMDPSWRSIRHERPFFTSPPNR